MNAVLLVQRLCTIILIACMSMAMSSFTRNNMIAKEFDGNCIEYAFLKLDPEFVNAEQRTKAGEALEAQSNKK